MKMNPWVSALPALVAFALAACAAPAPAPETAAPVETVATGFRAGQDGLAYAMIFDLREPFDTEVLAVAEFQNPVPGEPPMRVEQPVPAGQRRIALNSPVIREIGNHRDYTVVLTVYRDGAPLLTHRDTARFDVDEAMVPMFIRRGITVR
jgi:hypothetical protein